MYNMFAGKRFHFLIYFRKPISFKEGYNYMKEPRDLNQYHKKMVIESILKSIILGIISGFGLGLLFSFIFYLVVFDGLIFTIIFTILGAVLGSFLFFKLLYRPTIKTTASRMDAIGLEERVITMIELKDSDSFIAKKQREDTEVHLTVLTPKQLKFKSFLKPILSLVLAVVLSIGLMVLLASETSARLQEDEPPVIEEPEPSYEDQIIQALIEQLRNLVNTANVSQELKNDLHILINLLEASINPDDSLLVKKAKIEDARTEIIRRIQEELILLEIQALRDLVDNAPVSQGLKDELHELIDLLEESIQPEDTIAEKRAKIEETRAEILRRLQEEIITIVEELQKRETTEELGDAIDSKSRAIIDQTIVDMIDNFLSMPIEEMIPALLQTADDIEAALEDSNEDNEPLRIELQALADLLREMARIIEDGEEPQDAADELQDELQEIIDAIGDIVEAEDPSEEQELQDGIDEAIQDALDQLDQGEGNEPQEPIDPNDPNNPGNGEDPDPTDPVDPNDPGEGDPENPGENPGGGENPLDTKIIDGETSLVNELQKLIDDQIDRLQDPSLTDEERAAINSYVNYLKGLLP